MYKIYQKQLLEEGIVKQEDLKQLQDHVSGIMSAEFEAARTYKPEVRDKCLSFRFELAIARDLDGPFGLSSTATGIGRPLLIAIF